MRGARRRVWAGVGVAVLIVGVLAAWPALRLYTGAAPPRQISTPVTVDPALAGAAQRALGIAHNAGNNAATTRAALAAGADVVEIDVTWAHGGLAAGRDHWPRWLVERVFLGPSLAAAWDSAGPASTVKLDLTRSDRPFLDAVVAFLNPRLTGRDVLVSTRDRAAVLYLHQRLPAVGMLFTVAFPDAVDTVRADPALRSAVRGLSAFQGLVTPDLVRWAHGNGLIVVAWTVNDGDRLDDLLRLGVDGVTTANLAILSALHAPG